MWPHFYFILSYQSSDLLSILCCHLNLFSVINIVCVCTHTCVLVLTGMCIPMCVQVPVGGNACRHQMSFFRPPITIMVRLAAFCVDSGIGLRLHACAASALSTETSPQSPLMLFLKWLLGQLCPLHDTPSIPYISFHFLILSHLP